MVKEAVAPATVADEEECSQEDQGTDGAGLSLQQEAEQVEPHEHGVVEPQSWVQRLGDEQHGEQPLKAIHCLFLEGGRRCFLFQIYERRVSDRFRVEMTTALRRCGSVPLSNRTGMMQKDVKAARCYHQIIPDMF